MPRPKLTPNEEQRYQVKCLAAVGTPHEDIARKIGIRSAKTLRKYYREELDLAAIDANASVRGSALQQGHGGQHGCPEVLAGASGRLEQMARPHGTVYASAVYRGTRETGVAHDSAKRTTMDGLLL
jgi:hypothetical protein